MKKWFWVFMTGFFLCAAAVLGAGVYKYGSINGLVRRVQLEIASHRPKEPVVVPTFVAEATVDTAAFVAGLATQTAIPTVTPTVASTSAPTLAQPEPTLNPTATRPVLPSPSPAPLYQPAADFVSLTGYTHNWQRWNNCGPATLATYLSYLGKDVSQFDTAEVLKPNTDDKNVRVDEIAAYVEGRFPDLSVTSVQYGSAETLRLLLSNGFPVMLQTWLEEEAGDGMGHFRFLVGYDAETADWIVSDSYVSVGATIPYKGIRVDDAELIEHWAVFGNAYILIHRPEDRPLIEAIIGGDLDPKWGQAQALATYSARLQTEPDNPFVWHTLGDLLLAAGRPDEAVQAYDQARTIGLPWRMFWYNFGIFEAYMAVERYEDVIALADVTSDSGGGGEEIYYWKGMAHRALGEDAEANAAFQQALWWNPTHTASRDALSQP